MPSIGDSYWPGPSMLTSMGGKAELSTWPISFFTTTGMPPSVVVVVEATSHVTFGTFFGTLATAHEPRISACAVISVCHEPGCHTIFQEASPTFKKRFMYMSGITDEDEFDKMRQGMTWEGHADKIKVPYLCVAGEFDELSPIEHSVRLVNAVKGPKRMVVYQESRHSVGNVPAANLGPFPPILVADWLADRLAGKPFASEHWFVRSNGQIDKVSY